MFGTHGGLENGRVVIGVELSKTMLDNKQTNFVEWNYKFKLVFFFAGKNLLLEMIQNVRSLSNKRPHSRNAILAVMSDNDRSRSVLRRKCGVWVHVFYWERFVIGLFYRSSESLEVSSLELLEFDGGEESFEVSSAEAVVIRSLYENVIFLKKP